MQKAYSFLDRYFPTPVFLQPLAPAIDISQSSIKYLSGRVDQGTIYPLVFDEAPLGIGVIEKGEIKKPHELSASLASFVKRYPMTYAHFSLPEEGSYIYPLGLEDGLSDLEKRSRIEFSLSEHVPIPLESVVYDTVPIRGTNMVSVVAYDTRVSLMYEAIFEDIGVIPLSLEPHIFSSCRSAVPTNSDESILLIDIGKSRTSLAIVFRGVPITTTTVPVGGSCVTETIMRVLGKTQAESYNLKMTEGLSLTKTNPNLVQPLLSCLDAWGNTDDEF
jgi:Tfp pilus assembly PilM family ATPase